MDVPPEGWARSKGRWHGVRRVSPAVGKRATMVHAVCGLAFIAETPVQQERPKGGDICAGCSAALTPALGHGGGLGGRV